MTRPFLLPSFARASALLILALLALPAVADEASPWVVGAKSRARLVAQTGMYEGHHRVGVEIALDPATLTYWRHPGDAGIPPTFNFEGSTNLERAEVAYPAPKRIAEAGGDAFGYVENVIFPVRVTPTDSTKPVGLKLRLDYASCEKICIPAQADLRLELLAAKAAGVSAGVSPLQQFEARVPKVFVSDSKPLAGSEKAKVWRIVPPPGERVEDMFIEGPEGWFFESAVKPDGTLLATLAERPKAMQNTVEIRVTFARMIQPVETRLVLDTAP